MVKNTNVNTEYLHINDKYIIRGIVRGFMVSMAVNHIKYHVKLIANKGDKCYTRFLLLECVCVCVCDNLKLMITKDAVKTNNSVVYGMYRMYEQLLCTSYTAKSPCPLKMGQYNEMGGKEALLWCRKMVLNKSV